MSTVFSYSFPAQVSQQTIVQELIKVESLFFGLIFIFGAKQLLNSVSHINFTDILSGQHTHILVNRVLTTEIP
jgi:hypothetical protein